MENKKLSGYEDSGKTVHSWKFPVSAVWVVSTLLFCGLFAVTFMPRAKAQGREQGPASQYTQVLRSVFDFIERNYVEEVESRTLFEGAMTGMFNSLDDPHSSFLPELEMTDLGDTTRGSFGGVGLYISKSAAPSEGKPNFLEVAAPIEDTPGWRSGINAGDLVIRINDESTEQMTLDEAVTRLRGEPGTDVRLLVRRGEKIEFPVTLTRAVVEVPTVKHGMIGDVGYLKLITFTPMTIRRSREAIHDFAARGYKGVILDLRNNYGGLLDSAVDVSNLFFEDGLVVSTKSRIPSRSREYFARQKALVPQDIPVVVLINRGSASASEIVAGALKDRGRGYLVGEKSYGKGSVQEVYPLDYLPNKVGFKITIALYYTPSDVNIDKVGIPPDREVSFPEFTEADAEQLNSLLNSGKIAAFIKANPGAEKPDIEDFARVLNREYALDQSLLQRLIRTEQNRSSIAPVYDLEYDVQLQEAVKILKEEDFQVLMRTTKTLKTLQEEAVRDEEPALAS